MEVPAEANGVTPTSPERHDAESLDEGLETAPELPNMVGEMERAVEQSSGEITPEPSQSQVATEESDTRPSLEEVWESLQSSQAQTLEPQDVVKEKGSDDAPQTSPEFQTVSEIQSKTRPSSLRTRPRTGAKRNVTFKDDFEKVEEMEVQRPGHRKQAESRRSTVPPGCLGVFLALALAALIVYIASPNVPTKPRMWTSAELEKFNGTNNKPPLLLGILGSVFDVSKGWKHYGPGGSYHHFVGRDASRAFVSGNFTDDGLTDSLEGLTPSQIKAIDDWRIFFISRYVYLGKLVGPFYNKEGLPTKVLHLAEKKIKQASKTEKQQLLDEERFPNCNSRWTQDKGGEVWCNDGKFPRITELVSEGPRRGQPRTRCACLEQDELQLPGLKGYDGCDAQSSRCET